MYTHTYKYIRTDTNNIYIHTNVWKQQNCMTWQTHYFIK